MANVKTKINRFFKDGRTIGQVKQGPLGHYLSLYADHLYARGYPP